MSRTGSSMRAHSSQSWVILVMLFGSLLLILKYRLKVTTSKVNSGLALTVYNYFRSMGYNDFLASVFTAQAGHETNGFTSAIFKSNNNMYGMKHAGQLLSTGEKNGYANYLTLENSMLDLARWYNNRRSKLLSLPLIINDLKDYVTFLKNGKYFEDTEFNYLKGITFWNLKFKNE